MTPLVSSSIGLKIVSAGAMSSKTTYGKIRTRQIRNDQTVPVLPGLPAQRCADEYYREYDSRSETDEAIGLAELLIHPSDSNITNDSTLSEECLAYSKSTLMADKISQQGE